MKTFTIITFSICLYLSVDKSASLTCYSCKDCIPGSDSNSTQSVCGSSSSGSSSSSSSLSSSFNSTNSTITTTITTTTTTLSSTWSCSKSGVSVGTKNQFVYACIQNCVATNTGGFFSFIFSAGTWCCTSDLCNFSKSSMKSSMSSNLLNSGLITMLVFGLFF